MSARAAPGALRLATAGIGIVGVCFGMARYGYGLLLPDVRRDYGLSPATLGAVAMASYLAYLAATALAGAVARAHARRTAIAAGLTAAAGMAIAGLSHSPPVFVAGVLVAGASAGMAFAPFADAAREMTAAAPGRVLAAISCGTGYGVALAAPIAIVAGTSWRSAWLAFACAALGATWWAARVLPRDEPRRPRDGRAGGWTSVLCRRSLPLLAGAVLIGVGSAAYWTFAVEYLVDAGALSSTASRSFLGIVGVASVLATLSADLLARLGPAPAYRLAAWAEGGAVALLAVAPTSFAAAVASGGALRRRVQRRAGDPGDLGGAPVRGAPVPGHRRGDGGQRRGLRRRAAHRRPARRTARPRRRAAARGGHHRRRRAAGPARGDRVRVGQVAFSSPRRVAAT